MLINEIIQRIIIFTGILIFISFVAIAFISFRENEKRAARISLMVATILSALYFVVGLLPFKEQSLTASILLGITVVIVIGFLLPTGNKIGLEDDTPTIQIDERDIMFSRRLLQQGTERYDTYYRANPEKKVLDDKFREKPGLMQPRSTFYDPISFAATEASFRTVEALQPILDAPSEPRHSVEVDPIKITNFLKHWTKKLGAMSVGITRLKEYHKYSTIGRGDLYGVPLKLDHKCAIALTVEMDKSMVDHAPYGPTSMETAQQYLNVGNIAVQLAEFIKELGYPARAHIDGSYRVVCPLVARDAGLGEIGRMGLLMTPNLGPRVRLAVVTTDIPLITDERKYDPSVADFCSRCNKCAVNCPGKAIPYGEKSEINGIKRWQIDSEACFTYWCTVGTDCGRCMRVCPYSHPNNLMHNLIRKGIRNSVLFRIMAVKMDDFLYGRKPSPVPVPNWIKSASSNQRH